MVIEENLILVPAFSALIKYGRNFFVQEILSVIFETIIRMFTWDEKQKATADTYYR